MQYSSNQAIRAREKYSSHQPFNYNFDAIEAETDQISDQNEEMNCPPMQMKDHHYGGPKECYENSFNYDDEYANEDNDIYENVTQPTFEDLNEFIDSLASEVNELEIASNINEENDEHENDEWIQRRQDSSISELRSESEDIESKDSTDSGVNDDMSDTRSRRSGSILKYPGQRSKRTHIKHVEFFIDEISDDPNIHNVRYY